LATEETVYLSYADAVLIHILLMRFMGEVQYGVFDRSLLNLRSHGPNKPQRTKVRT
jgi:hypothetical protein